MCNSVPGKYWKKDEKKIGKSEIVFWDCVCATVCKYAPWVCNSRKPLNSWVVMQCVDTDAMYVY